MSSGMAWIMVLVLGVIAYQVRQLVQLQTAAARRQQRLVDTNVMLFYAVEQIYEISGMHERFLETLPKEGRMVAGVVERNPRTDVDDDRSTLAWATLVGRMQERMESAARIRYSQNEEPYEDPDEAMIRENGDEWLARLPLLERWPTYLGPCWFGVDGQPTKEAHDRHHADQ